MCKLKKYIPMSILILLFIALSFSGLVWGGKSNEWKYEYNTFSATDVSSNYVTANKIIWECPEFKNKTVTLKETGGDDSLTVRVRVRTSDDGVQTTLNTDTVLAGGETTLYFNNWYQEIEIAVISDGSGDVSADYGGIWNATK